MREDEYLCIEEYRGPFPRDEVLQTRFPIKTAVGLKEVIERREPIIITDVQSDSPLAHAYRESAPDRQRLLIGNVRSWMAVPLIVKDQVMGVLGLSHKEPDYFTPRHAQLALAIANQAAVAIENARLYERAQKLAAMEERQRLARELHDSVSQAFYGISLGVHTAIAMRDRDPVKVTEALNYVLSLADAGLTEMRALIFELRPDSLEVEGLTAALAKQTAALRARHGIKVDEDLSDEPSVPLKIKEAVYRIAQEALNNAVKHAHATRLGLRLSHDVESIMLEVSDDGIGFDPTGTYPGHLGLRSMRERAARLGGMLEIRSVPGQGTRVCARFPV
jgi:signal transduction histidine kinase